MSTHPTSGNSNRQANSGEHHEFQFKGTFLPVEAWNLLIDNTITAKDLVLASMIEALSKYGSGCWASNSYLAKQLKLTAHWVSESLSKLVEIGIIERTFEDNQRYLKTIWTGAVNKNSDVVGNHRGGVVGNHTISNTPTEYYKNKSNKHCRQADSGATPPRSRGDGSESPMFPIQVPGESIHHPRRAGVSGPKSKSKTPSPEARGYAARLLDKVIAAGLSQHKNHHRPDKWAIQFDKLEKGVPASTIAHVFNWLMEHYGEDFVPKIESGKAFYDKFQKLLDAIERDKKANPQVTITPDAEKVAKSLTTYFAWPKGSETQLPTVVQLSLDKVKQLREKLEHKYLPPEYRVKYLSPYITSGGHSQSMPSDIQVAHVIWKNLNSEFIQKWFEDIHKRVANWQQWSGKLVPFSPDAKEFRATAQGWTQSKCSDPKVCDKILKEITK